MVRPSHSNLQCDQIGRFIGLWASFQSLRQQLVCPNLPHSKAICQGVKIYLFLVKSFLATFIDIWPFFTGHTVPKLPPCPIQVMRVVVERHLAIG